MISQNQQSSERNENDGVQEIEQTLQTNFSSSRTLRAARSLINTNFANRQNVRDLLLYPVNKTSFCQVFHSGCYVASHLQKLSRQIQRQRVLVSRTIESYTSSSRKLTDILTRLTASTASNHPSAKFPRQPSTAMNNEHVPYSSGTRCALLLYRFSSENDSVHYKDISVAKLAHNCSLLKKLNLVLLRL